MVLTASSGHPSSFPYHFLCHRSRNNSRQLWREAVQLNFRFYWHKIPYQMRLASWYHQPRALEELNPRSPSMLQSFWECSSDGTWLKPFVQPRILEAIQLDDSFKGETELEDQIPVVSEDKLERKAEFCFGTDAIRITGSYSGSPEAVSGGNTEGAESSHKQHKGPFLVLVPLPHLPSPLLGPPRAEPPSKEQRSSFGACASSPSSFTTTMPMPSLLAPLILPSPQAMPITSPVSSSNFASLRSRIF
ncbi:MAG: hypothetical protein NXY57DRAFT_967090 [Lentinula lateritia]|nr:MAG: hypothetical protein NXY57DRAFT_967090 [Lentinula lateritia]